MISINSKFYTTLKLEEEKHKMIFNPTRLANGEGSTLGTLIFDIELVILRHR